MSLTAEWRNRIKRWQDALPVLTYQPLGSVEFSGFVTAQQLSPQAALKGQFKRMPAGTNWGRKWDYAWFKGSLRLPAAAAGRRIVLRANTGGESRTLVNGVEVGGIDRFHREILLAAKGRPGAVCNILIETYAGHGMISCNGGPCFPGYFGHPTEPERVGDQRTVGASDFGIWHEDLDQLWLDIQTLLESRDLLDPDSLRVARIDNALMAFTTVLDLELPLAEVLQGVAAARRILQPVLNDRNGSSAPSLDCFGHSHIDVAWLWPLAETERKCARTFATQLQLMEQYPEFQFLQSQPHLYRMTQRLYPDLYRRIKAAAKRGQWLAEGGLWVEPDTNVAGGEALIRQFIHGKRFFREEFGVESELMWLPDVFGYSGALPQIMAGCAIKYFSTQKIFWVDEDCDPFPYNSFWWEGIDGTRIFAHIHNDYNSATNPKALFTRWKERVQKNELVSRMVPFGHGDGGGGPTRHHLEFLRRQKNLEGLPKVNMVSPVTYCREEARRRKDWPVYVGELYLSRHRGTYTTQARTKRGNRRCEFGLREAELWGGLAQFQNRASYPLAAMDEAWKGVLLNQFHDILPGSSIHRVYAEAEALYAQVLKQAQAVAVKGATSYVKKAATALTVFNSLSWERTELLPLPKDLSGAAHNGTPLPVQTVAGTTLVEVSVPSCGFTTLTAAPAARCPAAVSAGKRVLENEFLRLAVNSYGEIASLVDKTTGQELAAAPLNSFCLYQDVPQQWDAWDIDISYEMAPVPLKDKARIQVLAAGPLVGVLRIQRRLHHSALTQEIWLRRNSRSVEFRTRIDWHEKHKLLKVAFPTAIHANEALHEIQFGHIARPNHRSRPFDRDRFEVCNQKWTALCEENRGIAVLNDCKYGISTLDGRIALTLLRAPVSPDFNVADQGMQEFTYSLYAWNGSFWNSDLVQKSYELNAPLWSLPGQAGTASCFSLDAPNVILETVKPAEDGSGDLVLRLYESKNAATACRLAVQLPFSTALATNMLEEHGRAVAVKGDTIPLRFRPFEIKTLRLKK